MTEDKGILIKNVYYMLSYAFQYLKQSQYQNLQPEDFENIYELLSEILIRGITQQLKQGLYREYIPFSDDIPTVRGRISIDNSIKLKLQQKQKLHCDFDELSENNIFNQILKSISLILLPKIKNDKKKKILYLMSYFQNVEQIHPYSIHWNRLKYQRSNKNYEMLINICHFTVDGLLLSTDDGNYKIANFIDEERMHALFEKFVLQYYRSTRPELHAAPAGIPWAVQSTGDTLEYLPAMVTDITLRDAKNNKTLIIDTKYYGETMQKQYDKATYHSNNMYQLLSYIKNKEVEVGGKVGGILLYAKTQEDVVPNQEFEILGNYYSLKTLDLNQEFAGIKNTLDNIAENYFR